MQRHEFDDFLSLCGRQFESFANLVRHLRTYLSVLVHISVLSYRFRLAHVVQKSGKSQSRWRVLAGFERVIESVVKVIFLRLFHAFERCKFWKKHIEDSEFVEHFNASDMRVFQSEFFVFRVGNENFFKLVAHSLDRQIFDSPRIFPCGFKGVFFNLESEFGGESHHTQDSKSVRLEHHARLVGGGYDFVFYVADTAQQIDDFARFDVLIQSVAFEISAPCVKAHIRCESNVFGGMFAACRVVTVRAKSRVFAHEFSPRYMHRSHTQIFIRNDEIGV